MVTVGRVYTRNLETSNIFTRHFKVSEKQDQAKSQNSSLGGKNQG